MEDRTKLLSNYVNESLIELPLKLNEKTSYGGIKYQYRHEFDDLKMHINNFLEDVDDERFIVLPGMRGVENQHYYFRYMNIC